MELNINYRDCNIFLWKKNRIVKHIIMPTLNFEFINNDFDFVLFLKFDTPDALSTTKVDLLISSLETILQDNQNTFMILTPRKTAPVYRSNMDEFVYSFSCNFQNFKNIIINNLTNEVTANDLLFKLLDQIFKGKSNFERFLIKQIPLEYEIITSIHHCDVIIPHKGKNEYLSNVLFFLDKIKEINLYVGIDQNISKEILELKAKYFKACFYYFNQTPVGPYVIRNQLIEKSDNELLFFQDSDDTPCADRFQKLSDFMHKHGCQLCGSHELRIDYFDKTIQAIRFPGDVRMALKAESRGHPLLHPTSAITRTAFNLCGKFSEDRTFGYDTQFLLRSFFLLNNIMNIDEFLYIRRLRPGSLTTSPETNMESPARQDSLKIWYNDFDEIKKGTLNLKNSSLNYRNSISKNTIKTIP